MKVKTRLIAMVLALPILALPLAAQVPEPRVLEIDLNGGDFNLPKFRGPDVRNITAVDVELTVAMAGIAGSVNGGMLVYSGSSFTLDADGVRHETPQAQTLGGPGNFAWSHITTIRWTDPASNWTGSGRARGTVTRYAFGTADPGVGWFVNSTNIVATLTLSPR